MVNYVALIGEFYSDVEVSCVGDGTDYSSLVWKSTVVSQAELDSVHLTAYKDAKIAEFSANTQAEIIDGFDSNALTTPHVYDSEFEDQVNLIGAVATQSDMYYSCREYTNGYQTVNVGGAKVGTDLTGFANDTTLYNAEVVVDGSSTYLSIEGQTAQTIDALLTVMNTDADFGALASVSLVSGNIKVKSKSFGSSSTVQIINTNLFSSLTGFVGLGIGVVGIDGINNSKEYKFHTHAQLLTVINDGAAVKLTLLQKFAVKRAQVQACTTIAEVDAITW